MYPVPFQFHAMDSLVSLGCLASREVNRRLKKEGRGGGEEGFVGSNLMFDSKKVVTLIRRDIFKGYIWPTLKRKL